MSGLVVFSIDWMAGHEDLMPLQLSVATVILWLMGGGACLPFCIGWLGGGLLPTRWVLACFVFCPMTVCTHVRLFAGGCCWGVVFGGGGLGGRDCSCTGAAGMY